MKKFTRICLIIAGGCAAIGIALCVIAIVCFGANWKNITKYTPFIDFDTKEIYTYEEGGDGSYTFSDFENLDIEIAAGSLEVMEGDTEQTEVTVSDEDKMSVYIGDDRTLCIKVKDGTLLNDDEKIKVIVPEGMAIGKFDLEIAAGEATIEELTCNQYDIECAAGKVELELYGEQKNYNFDIECGVGQIKIGNETISGLAQEKHEENKNASGNVDIECGAGEVVVSFGKEI